MQKTITATPAPLSGERLKQYAKLLQKKYRQQSGLYSMSGLRAVKGALSCAPRQLECLVVEKGREALLEDLTIRGSDRPVFSVDSRGMERLTEEKTAQGIVMIGRRQSMAFNADSFRAPRALYLEAINDPGNLGTVLRSASWFGYRHVFLSPDSADPWNPKALRASAGYAPGLHLYENVAAGSLERLSREQGYKMYATALDGDDINNIVFEKKHILLFGSEAHGLSRALQDKAGQKITIARNGEGESLNLSVAASICMFCATRAADTGS